MLTFRRIFCLAVLVYVPALKAEVPAGFESPGLMARLEKGEIVLDEKISTKTEFLDVFRAYFNKVSPDAYAGLVTTYSKYPDMFDQIEEATLLTTNPDRTIFTYKLKMNVAVGPFHSTIYPEGRHTITLNTIGESKVYNEITNYQDHLETATETTRLIPYQGGMLVEDTVHAKLKKANAASGMVKKKLQAMFKGFIKGFRKELHGDY